MPLLRGFRLFVTLDKSDAHVLTPPRAPTRANDKLWPINDRSQALFACRSRDINQDRTNAVWQKHACCFSWCLHRLSYSITIPPPEFPTRSCSCDHLNLPAPDQAIINSIARPDLLNRRNSIERCLKELRLFASYPNDYLTLWLGVDMLPTKYPFFYEWEWCSKGRQEPDLL